MAGTEQLQLVRGSSLEKYKKLGTDYAGSLFFDTSTNKIYLGTESESQTGESILLPIPMDSSIAKSNIQKSNGTHETMLHFTGSTGEMVSINEASIPSLDGKDAFGKLDISSAESGFMSVKDKYILDNIAEALGVKVTISKGVAKFEMDEIGSGGSTGGNTGGGSVPSSSTGVSLYFDGGSTSDDTEILVDHGNLKAGTTIGDLEKLTLSEVFKQILLETAKPTKAKDLSYTISWKTPYDSTIDVGRSLPYGNSYIQDSFQPETWQWTASDGKTKGEPAELNVKQSFKYYKNDTQTLTVGPNTTELETVSNGWEATTEGINGYFFAVCTYNSGTDALDSMGNTADSYGKAYSGTITSNQLTYAGAWKIYANACQYYTSAQQAFNQKDVEGTYRGIDTQTGYTFVTGATTIILQWPKKADLDTDQKLYIYIPYNQTKYKASSAINISDTTAAFNGAELSVTFVEDVSISNGYETGTFSKYEISPNAGVTTCQITVMKGQHI